MAQNGEFETLTFKDVEAFIRETWNLDFLKVEQSENKVTISGSVPSSVPAGTLTETFVINGDTIKVKLTVTEAETFAAAPVASPILLTVENRKLHLSGIDAVNLDVFDMQGRSVAMFKQVKGSVSLETLRQGSYVVRVRAGSNSLIRRIVLK